MSSFDKEFTVTPGNNGCLYVVVPVKALLLALDASSGNVLWQGSIGPLSSLDSAPVVDSNGKLLLFFDEFILFCSLMGYQSVEFEHFFQ